MKTRKANSKTPAVFSFQGPFPLTPALSPREPRERENQRPRFDNFKRLGFSSALPTMLPLPEGEGRGEGEQIVRIPERILNRARACFSIIPILHYSSTPFL